MKFVNSLFPVRFLVLMRVLPLMNWLLLVVEEVVGIKASQVVSGPCIQLEALLPRFLLLVSQSSQCHRSAIVIKLVVLLNSLVQQCLLLFNLRDSRSLVLSANLGQSHHRMKQYTDQPQQSLAPLQVATQLPG